MSRTKGATNKDKQDPLFALSIEQRLELIANIVLDIVTDEQSLEPTQGE